MPVARYFIYVGGVLITLLLFLDAYLPKSSIAESLHPRRPSIRIHSAQKLPDLVVYDTDLPTIVPDRAAEISIPAPPLAAEVTAKVREREAFAKMQLADLDQRKPANPKLQKSTPQRRAHGKRYAPPPYAYFAERRPRFGWFDRMIW